MKFVDEVIIHVEAGAGGNGCMSFRREKYAPRGGPDGGDGGGGGDVVLVGDPGISTLLDLRYNQHQRAKHGVHGKGKQMTGARSKDKLVRVPLGTIASDAETGEVLGEVLEINERLRVAKGGRGGRGNLRFVSSVNRAPRRADPGEPGEARRVRLELKLLADVGLVGFPNAGKSTLISALSAARPKIADYPFTTLVPNLGVVRTKSGFSFVMADIPGLIEGASDGAGMGIQFLRHVERCSVLAFLLDFSTDRESSPLEDYRVLCSELERFAPEMLKKPRVVGLNKMDLNPDPEQVEEIRAFFAQADVPFTEISAATRRQIDDLVMLLDMQIPRPVEVDHQLELGTPLHKLPGAQPNDSVDDEDEGEE